MNGGDRETLRCQVGKAVCAALEQVCGGGVIQGPSGTAKRSFVTQEKDDDGFRRSLRDLAYESVSFPNKSLTVVGGKPHDVEVRAPLTLFHRFCGHCRKRKRPEETSPSEIHIVSDMGLARSIESPSHLARIVCTVLEEECRKDGICHDVRFNSSGIICIVSQQRAAVLRQSGRLPCHLCVKWLKGEKGLWWHQQREHKAEHSVAAEAAASERTELAVVLFGTNMSPLYPIEPRVDSLPSTSQDQFFDHVRKGRLKDVIQAVTNGYDPCTAFDRNGASPLLWAAGSGNLEIVKYLIEQCNCSAEQGQRGKRSFSMRTPLHWAARNGHLPVVAFLVNICHVDLDAATADGTTAFCWACWQGHLEVMEFLYQAGCDIHMSNSFGCNAVLWCAQGSGRIEALKWLRSVECDLLLVNSNGHGALHKAAQRGRDDICRWLILSVFVDMFSVLNVKQKLLLIGPDSDGCCPSDLAGMEGHRDLALWIAGLEISLVQTWCAGPSGNLMRSEARPSWLRPEHTVSCCQLRGSDLNAWEPGGGVRRMRYNLDLL